MATLADLRERVRSQTQTTDAELPNDDVDEWLREGFNRTIAGSTTWPFYEYTWSLTLVAGESTVDFPTSPYTLDQSGVVALVDGTTGARLAMVSSEWAESFYSVNGSASATAPTQFSVWGSTIVFWPTTSMESDRTYSLRGYRRPSDWIASGAGTECDCDERFHLPIAHYATSLAYAQQEDSHMERIYMERWQKDVQMAADAIMHPGHQLPLTMGPRYITPIGLGYR